MFIKTNDRLVNLKNVSNINIIDKKQRVVFNLNYNIEINNYNESKLISDYVYLDARDKQDFELILEGLALTPYIEKHFISHKNGYVNVDEISSIKFAEKKNRVIINLSHPVTFTDYNQNNKITSEFVYINCLDHNHYKQFSHNLNLRLLGER